jgi:RNA polymerase sigma factor (sigma-70 family)
LKDSALQQELFIEFLEKNKALIVKVAGVYCYDQDERKDLIQDIILQLWRAFPGFNDSASITTWMYRIALNVSISYLRKNSTRKKTHEQYGRQTSFIEWDAHFKDERLELLYRYINYLKPMDKAIIILHLDGVKNKDIAEILGIKPTNVSTRLQRIKEILSTNLIT